MKSRKSLKGEQKYHLADPSSYFALNTDNRIDYGPVLENIVYSYARSLGHEVSAGRIGGLGCDFVVRSPEMEYAYVQVAMTIMNIGRPRTASAARSSGCGATGPSSSSRAATPSSAAAASFMRT